MPPCCCCQSRLLPPTHWGVAACCDVEVSIVVVVGKPPAFDTPHAAAAQLDDGALYVKKLAARRVARQLGEAGCVVLAGLDGPAARALAVQVR